MNKISHLIKKHLLVGTLSLVIIVLAASHLSIFNKVNNGTNRVLAFEQGILGEDSSKDSGQKSPELAEVNTQLTNISGLPHPSCIEHVLYGTTPSDVYNGDTPYNLAFFGTSMSGFQDVNGDNLTDYVYVNNTFGGTQLDTNSIACVYLNNGSGWTKAFECYAHTIVDSSGTAITKEYRGDCAGTPSSNGDKKE